MNKLRHALCVILVATTCALRAADKDEDESPLGDFMPTNDDLVQYVPKFSMKLGLRTLGGVHTKFSGSGGINLGTLNTDYTTPNLSRNYHDGSVLSNQATASDPAGNPVNVSPTGTTNTWGYADASQVQGAYIAMHDYQTELKPVSDLRQNPSSSLGVELTGERDMGSVFNTRLHWGVVAGFSINQISSIRVINEPGYIHTTTDYYRMVGAGGSLPFGGVEAPSAPYTQTGTSSDPIYVTNTPVNPNSSTDTPYRAPVATSDGLFYTRWRLRGAYVSFRAGPTLTIPITAKFSASLSAGAVLMYVGTSYDVEQQFKPATGDLMDSDVSDGASGVLPGYYADATLQYTINENSGMYLGAVIQGTQTYSQEIKSNASNDYSGSDFKAKVDFGNMEGVKGGFLFKF